MKKEDLNLIDPELFKAVLEHPEFGINALKLIISPIRKQPAETIEIERYDVVPEVDIQDKAVKVGILFTNGDILMLTIHKNDYFQKDSMIYTFQYRCVDDPSIVYDEGYKTIYLNPIGKSNKDDAIAEMEDYVVNSRSENAINDNLEKLHLIVEKIRDEKANIG